jgi:hypothetical protein
LRIASVRGIRLNDWNTNPISLPRILDSSRLDCWLTSMPASS